MKKLFIRYVLLFCCVVMVTPFSGAYGSTTFDRVSAVEGDTSKLSKVFRATEYGHNVFDMLQQGRYRYGDAMPYSNRGILSHLSFGTSMGIDFMAPRYNFDYNPALMWGLRIGKELNKNNALSLNFLYGKSEMKSDDAYFYRYALQLNHYFNFTRYYLGYNPYRALELSSMIGAGYQFGEVYGQSESAPYITLGMKGDIRLGNRVKLAIEPYVNFGSEGYNGAGKGFWYSKYNVSYGARAAVNYTFDNKLNGVMDTIPFSRNYMFVTTGLQSLNANIDFVNTLAPTLAVGYGRWLAPRFAMQFSAGWSAGGWQRINSYDAEGNLAYTRYPKSQYFFGRAEAVYNIFSALKDKKMQGFALDVMGGYEFGKLWKYGTDVYNQYTDNYDGLTAALRMKYYHSEGKAFYLEPRVTFVDYATEGDGHYSDVDYRRYDTRYSLALGMEYGNPAIDGKGRLLKSEDGFEPRLSVLAMFGPNYVFNRDAFSGGTNVNGSYAFGIEYQPFRLFGARVMADYSTYSFNLPYTYNSDVDGVIAQRTGIRNKQFDVLSGIIDAKLDLTNLLYGYNYERRWNSALYLGAVISNIVDESNEHIEGSAPVNGGKFKDSDKDKTHVGGHVAFNTSYRLNNYWRLFGEVDMRIYGNEFLANNSLDYNPVRTMSFRVGSSYSLDARDVFYAMRTAGISTGNAIANFYNTITDNENMPFSPNYFFISGGIQSVYAAMSFDKTVGPALTLGYGHWFSKHLGYQLSGGWSSGGWYVTGYKKVPKHQYVFGRGELMINALRLLNEQTGRGFSLTALAGYDLGYTWRYRNSVNDQTSAMYHGFTGGLRFKYHSTEGKNLYIEPRLTYTNFDDNQLVGTKYDVSRLVTRFTLSAGVELGTPYYGGAGSLYKPEIEDEFVPKTSVFVALGPNYVFNRESYLGGTNLNGSYAIGLEYQPYKLFGARAMFDYSTYASNKRLAYKGLVDGVEVDSKGIWRKNYNILSAIVDAKFDLSNMIYGYDSQRRWNSALYLGAVLSRYDNISGELKEGPEPVKNINFDNKRPNKNFLGGHLAFNTSYRVSEKFGVFGEADLRVYGNDFISDDAIDYNPVRTLAFRLGASYSLDANDVLRADDIDMPFAPSYFFISGGIQSAYAAMNFKNTIGPALTLGYGHWFSKYFGYQLSGGWSAGAWYTTSAEKYPKSQWAFGRAELMVNAFRALNENTGRGFSLTALAGAELGNLWRYRNTVDDQTSAGYGGFTGGLRFKYHSREGKNLFVEPRLTYAHFNDDYFEGTKYSVHRLLTRFTLSAGIELGSPYNCGAGSLVRPDDEFEPKLSVFAMAGPEYMFNRETYGKEVSMDYSVALGAEYQPYKNIGFRAMLDVEKFTFTQRGTFTANKIKALFDRDYTFLSGIVDVKFDMSNIIYGYDSERRWNTALYVGPIVSKCTGLSTGLHSGESKPELEGVKFGNNKPEDMNIGLHTAFNAKYSINKDWNLFGEADLRFHSNKFITEYAVDYNPVRTLGFRFGVSYNIK